MTAVDIEAVACDGVQHFALGRVIRTGQPVAFALSPEEAHGLAYVLASSGEPIRALIHDWTPLMEEMPMPVH
jgi:hypothetical protein